MQRRKSIKAVKPDEATEDPEELKALGEKIKTTWNELKANEKGWPERIMAFAKALLAGRTHRSIANGRPGDLQFGKWLKENGYNFVTADNRAALLNLARNEAKAMKALRATTSDSVRSVWQSINPKKKEPKAKGSGKSKGTSTETTPTEETPQPKERAQALNTNGSGGETVQSDADDQPEQPAPEPEPKPDNDGAKAMGIFDGLEDLAGLIAELDPRRFAAALEPEERQTTRANITAFIEWGGLAADALEELEAKP